MASPISKQQIQTIVASIVMLGVFSFLYVQYFWLPISADMDQLNEDISRIDTKIQKAESQAARLGRLQADLATLNQQAAEAEKRLPQSKEIPDVIVALSKLAMRSKITIQSFAPGPVAPERYFSELRYPMSVKGTYHNIGRFLAALALEERIFNIRDVVYPTPGTDGQMTVTFTLIAYQYKPG